MSSRLDRFLRLFARVEAGEGATTLAMALDVFLILTAYYIIKPVREALVLSLSGADVKAYLAAGQALLLLLVAVPAYSWLASRVPRRRLIQTVNLFFAANLVLFWVAGRWFDDAPWFGALFYLWVGIFNLMVPAQFWSFANDWYTPGQGKRLFAIVAFGASAGAVLGSQITSMLLGPVGLFQLLLLSAGLLVVANGITLALERRPNPRAADAPPVESAPAPSRSLRSLGRGFQLVATRRYLLLIALLMLFLNWVNTNGEYILGRVVEADAARQAAAAAQGTTGSFDANAFEGEVIGRFYADFFMLVNVVGLLMQLFLVSRIIGWIGVRGALLVLPCISLGSYLFIFANPAQLGVIRWAKTAENATDYSLQNTVRQALFLPTSFEEKYQGKQAIDSFFHRSGDVLAALVVLVGTEFMAWPLRGFAAVNLVLVGVWFGLALAIGREFQRRSAATG